MNPWALGYRAIRYDTSSNDTRHLAILPRLFVGGIELRSGLDYLPRTHQKSLSKSWEMGVLRGFSIGSGWWMTLLTKSPLFNLSGKLVQLREQKDRFSIDYSGNVLSSGGRQQWDCKLFHVRFCGKLFPSRRV